MKKVYLLSGISGSGKSTFAKEFLSENGHLNVVYLSTDEIREDHNLDFTDKAVFTILNEAYSKAVANPAVDVIIVDATNLTRKRRSVFKRKGVHITVVLFMSTLDNAVNRVNLRGHTPVPEASIKTQLIALEPPVIGVDCDSFVVRGASFFNDKIKVVNGNPTLAPFAFPNVESLLSALKPEVKDNELSGIARSHRSRFHAESISTHINMTVNLAHTVDLKTVALFHDLGKPIARVDHENYSSFKRHERYGAILYLNYIASVTNSFDKEITVNDENLLTILYHMLMFNDLSIKTIVKNGLNPSLLDKLFAFNEIDKKCSMRSVKMIDEENGDIDPLLK